MGALPLALLFLQATGTAKGSAGIGGIAPVLLPDVPLTSLLLIAALNPVTIAVAWIMGRRADAPAKLLIAGFAAAAAGSVLVWLGTLLRLGFLATPARAAGGIFVAGMAFATFYAWLAYRTRARETRSPDVR
jgi:hypothetical protein